jgi:ABC-type multidrug transport system fused ATPase/permease subunit
MKPPTADTRDPPDAPPGSETVRETPVPWVRAWPLVRRFLPWMRDDRRTAWTIFVLLVLAVPAGIVSPWLVKRVFDEALATRDVDLLVSLGVWILGFTIASHALRMIAAQLGVNFKVRVRERVARDLFAHALRLPLRWHHRHETGYVMARVKDDVGALDALMTDTLSQAAVDAGRAVLFFVLLLFTDLGLAITGLLLIAVIALGVVACSKPLRRRSERYQESEAEFSSALHQALSGLFTARVAAQEPREERRFGEYVHAALDALRGRDQLHVVLAQSIGLALAIGSYGILTLGAFRIFEGTTTIGSLFQFSIYLTYVGGAVTSLMALNPAIQHGLNALTRIYRVLDEPREGAATHEAAEAPEPLEAHAPAPSTATISGRVEFDRVSFRYDEHALALQAIDLDVAAGEVIALVGRSGSGKTTLAHLIPRLHDPTEGEVRIDGVPLPRYDLRALRARIGVVPQDVFLFDRSIRDNIAYGAPDAPDDAILAAARAAHVDEFVSRLPRGYDSRVGERGVKLSGGERQRIAIARELLRDPRILILDEATSSLDTESEALIRDALEKLMTGRTCFVIAHRLSTIAGADRIVVLDRGRIVEIGAHRELADAGGAYSRLLAHARLD